MPSSRPDASSTTPPPSRDGRGHDRRALRGVKGDSRRAAPAHARAQAMQVRLPRAPPRRRSPQHAASAGLPAPFHVAGWSLTAWDGRRGRCTATTLEKDAEKERNEEEQRRCTAVQPGPSGREVGAAGAASGHRTTKHFRKGARWHGTCGLRTGSGKKGLRLSRRSPFRGGPCSAPGAGL